MKPRSLLALALLLGCTASFACDRIGDEIAAHGNPPPQQPAPKPARSGGWDEILLGTIDYVVYPLAPGWSLHETLLAQDRVRIELKLDRFHLGADGAALQVFRQRADAIAASGGYAGYRIARFAEGIDSGWVSRRTAAGEIVLSR